MGRVWVGLAALGMLAGCAHTQAAAQADPAPAAPAALVYVDPSLGFEIARPRGDAWRFSPGVQGELDPAVSVPVIVAHRASGAQVVVQVAPEVAPPLQFAQRLTEGLRARPGFTVSDIEPLAAGHGAPLAAGHGAVGFAFTLGNQVAGRVAVVSGSGDRVYVLLATWPQDAPPDVVRGVDEIVRSLHTKT